MGLLPSGRMALEKETNFTYRKIMKMIFFAKIPM